FGGNQGSWFPRSAWERRCDALRRGPRQARDAERPGGVPTQSVGTRAGSPLGLELRRVDQCPEDVLERLGATADLLDVVEALPLLAVGRLAGEGAQVDRLQRLLVGRMLRQDAAQHVAARRGEALVDLRVVHQDQRLRDAALDVLRLQRRVEAEL